MPTIEQRVRKLGKAVTFYSPSPCPESHWQASWRCVTEEDQQDMWGSGKTIAAALSDIEKQYARRNNAHKPE